MIRLDIGQVLFLRVYGSRRSRGPYTRKKKANIQPSWPNKLGQQRIYYMAEAIARERKDLMDYKSNLIYRSLLWIREFDWLYHLLIENSYASYER